MLFMETTQNCAGVVLYGDYTDLRDLYETVSTIADTKVNVPRLTDYLYGFCYDIRHAYQGEREIIRLGFDQEDKDKYYGVKILFPSILFFYKSLRWLSGFIPTKAVHQANLFRLQACIEETILKDEFSNSARCVELLNQNLGMSNDYLIIFLDQLNLDFMKMNKKERKENLCRVLCNFNPLSNYYLSFSSEIYEDAQRKGTSPFSLSLNFEEPKFRW